MLVRLRGEPSPLEEPAALVAFLEERCGGLLAKLEQEWYEDGSSKRELKPQYAGPSSKAKKKGKK